MSKTSSTRELRQHSDPVGQHLSPHRWPKAHLHVPAESPQTWLYGAAPLLAAPVAALAAGAAAGPAALRAGFAAGAGALAVDLEGRAAWRAEVRLRRGPVAHDAVLSLLAALAPAGLRAGTGRDRRIAARGARRAAAHRPSRGRVPLAARLRAGAAERRLERPEVAGKGAADGLLFQRALPALVVADAARPVRDPTGRAPLGTRPGRARGSAHRRGRRGGDQRAAEDAQRAPPRHRLRRGPSDALHGEIGRFGADVCDGRAAGRAQREPSRQIVDPAHRRSLPRRLTKKQVVAGPARSRGPRRASR